MQSEETRLKTVLPWDGLLWNGDTFLRELLRVMSHNHLKVMSFVTIAWVGVYPLKLCKGAALTPWSSHLSQGDVLLAWQSRRTKERSWGLQRWAKY